MHSPAHTFCLLNASERENPGQTIFAAVCLCFVEDEHSYWSTPYTSA